MQIFSRDDQDAFAQGFAPEGLCGDAAGHFAAEISPYAVKLRVPDLKTGEVIVKDFSGRNRRRPLSG